MKARQNGLLITHSWSLKEYLILKFYLLLLLTHHIASRKKKKKKKKKTVPLRMSRISTKKGPWNNGKQWNMNNRNTFHFFFVPVSSSNLLIDFLHFSPFSLSLSLSLIPSHPFILFPSISFLVFSLPSFLFLPFSSFPLLSLPPFLPLFLHSFIYSFNIYRPWGVPIVAQWK